MTYRRAALVCTATAVLGTALIAAPHSPAADPRPQAVVADALLRDAAAGPTPAVLTWDRHATSSAEVSAHLAHQGLRATVLDGLPVAFACAGGPGDVRALATAPGALSVWGDESLQPAATPPSSTAASTTPGTAPATAADLGVDGSGISLAVVDSGLDGRHEAFAGRLRSNVRVLVSHREFLGPGDPPPCQDVFTAELEDSEVTAGHGTHIAGVAAGAGGVAPGARLVGVGVSDTVTVDTDVRDSTRFSMFAALAGLNYALSVGLDGADPVKAVLAGWVGSGLQDPFHPLSLAIRDLHDFGISVVLPVGNQGPDDSDCSRAETCRISPYAVGSFAIGVGATSAGDAATLASFSSRGDPQTRTSAGLPVAYEPLLAAPGENVLGPRRIGTHNVTTPPGSLHGGGGSPTTAAGDLEQVAMSGTSVAAAQVAGAVVLMQQGALQSKGCYLPAQDVRRLLAETAAPMTGHERWQAGAGRLDVAAAVAAARTHEPTGKISPWMCPRTTGVTTP